MGLTGGDLFTREDVRDTPTYSGTPITGYYYFGNTVSSGNEVLYTVPTGTKLLVTHMYSTRFFNAGGLTTAELRIYDSSDNIIFIMDSKQIDVNTNVIDNGAIVLGAGCYLKYYYNSDSTSHYNGVSFMGRVINEE